MTLCHCLMVTETAINWYSGDLAPFDVLHEGNSLLIHFTSDKIIQENGVKFQYKFLGNWLSN